jgi:putative xylitol transport system permease protein
MTIEIPEEKTAVGVRRFLRRLSRHQNAVLAIILAAIIATLGGLTHGGTLTASNVRNIWIQSSTRGIAAVGQLFVILTAGIDLSVGGMAMLSAIVGGVLMSTESAACGHGAEVYGLPVAVGVVTMLLIGLVSGTVNGALVSRVSMPPLIVTLALWEIADGLGLSICKGLTISHFPDGLTFFGQGNVGGVPVPVIIFVAVAAVAYFVLNYTTFGRAVRAVGGDPEAAWLSGINVPKVRFSVYVISGFLATLAGVVVLSRSMAAFTGTAEGLELDSITAVCIGGVSLMGGRGTLVGVVIGVLILGVINNGMNVFAIEPALQFFVKGAIIIIAVAVDTMRRRQSHLRTI